MGYSAGIVTENMLPHLLRLSSCRWRHHAAQIFQSHSRASACFGAFGVAGVAHGYGILLDAYSYCHRHRGRYHVVLQHVFYEQLYREQHYHHVGISVARNLYFEVVAIVLRHNLKIAEHRFKLVFHRYLHHVLAAEHAAVVGREVLYELERLLLLVDFYHRAEHVERVEQKVRIDIRLQQLQLVGGILLQQQALAYQRTLSLQAHSPELYAHPYHYSVEHRAAPVDFKSGGEQEQYVYDDHNARGHQQVERYLLPQNSNVARKPYRPQGGYGYYQERNKLNGSEYMNEPQSPLNVGERSASSSMWPERKPNRRILSVSGPGRYKSVFYAFCP